MTIELVEIYTPKMLRCVKNNFLDTSQYALAFSEREGDYVTQNLTRSYESGRYIDRAYSSKARWCSIYCWTLMAFSYVPKS